MDRRSLAARALNLQMACFQGRVQGTWQIGAGPTIKLPPKEKAVQYGCKQIYDETQGVRNLGLLIVATDGAPDVMQQLKT